MIRAGILLCVMLVVIFSGCVAEEGEAPLPAAREPNGPIIQGPAPTRTETSWPGGVEPGARDEEGCSYFTRRDNYSVGVAFFDTDHLVPVDLNITMWPKPGCTVPANHTLEVQVMDAGHRVVAGNGTHQVRFRTDLPGVFWIYASGTRPNGSLVDHQLRYYAIGGGDRGVQPCEYGNLTHCPHIPVFVPQYMESVRFEIVPEFEFALQPGIFRVYDAAGELVHETVNRSIYGVYRFAIDVPDHNWTTGADWHLEYQPIVPTTARVAWSVHYNPFDLWHDGIPKPVDAPCRCA